MLFVTVLFGVLGGFLLGRFARMAGCLVALLGVLPMAALFVYETYFYTKGDTSFYGMFSTILLLILVPLGLTVLLVGWLRS